MSADIEFARHQRLDVRDLVQFTRDNAAALLAWFREATTESAYLTFDSEDRLALEVIDSIRVEGTFIDSQNWTPMVTRTLAIEGDWLDQFGRRIEDYTEWTQCAGEGSECTPS